MDMIRELLVQIPSFILGDDSGQTQETGLSLSGSTQYSLTLGSYLQGLGETMTPPVAGGQSVGVEEMDRSLVNISETESSAEHTLHGHLLQMVGLCHSLTCVQLYAIVSLMMN